MSSRASLAASLSLGLLMLGSSACIFGVKLPGQEGRACDERQRCLDGYICKDRVCVSSGLGRSCDFSFDNCSEGFCHFDALYKAYCTVVCSASADCPAGFRCLDQDSLQPGTRICQPEATLAGDLVGTAELGESCVKAEDCHSGLCSVGSCSDSCQSDAQCGASGDYHCKLKSSAGRMSPECVKISPSSSGLQGASCASSATCELGACVNDAVGNGQCADPCCSSADCPAGTACWLLSWSGWTPDNGVARLCVPFPRSATAGFGDPCARDEDCLTGTCWTDPNTQTRACTDLCCSDSDCPASYVCSGEPFDLSGDGRDDVSVPVCITHS